MINGPSLKAASLPTPGLQNVPQASDPAVAASPQPPPEPPATPAPGETAVITPGITASAATAPVAANANVGDRQQLRQAIQTEFAGHPAEASEVREIFNRMLQNGIPIEDVLDYVSDTAAVMRQNDPAAFEAQVARMDSISQGRNSRADAELDEALAEVDRNTRSDGTIRLGSSQAQNLMARAGITIGSPAALEAGFARNGGSLNVNAQFLKNYLRAEHASAQDPGNADLRANAERASSTLGALGPIITAAQTAQPSTTGLNGLAGTSAGAPRPQPTPLPGLPGLPGLPTTPDQPPPTSK
ncbi:MAG: hypothetical protein ACO1RX_11425 [Candidatus Sericytochromatia bacterium]